jgi:DNA-binding NtrC family response regulator
MDGTAIFKKRKGEISVVILDMIMPGMTGRETFEALKKIEPGVRVILSSGYSLNGQAREILEQGCRGFIQKPFDIMRLSQKIGEVLQDTGGEAVKRADSTIRHPDRSICDRMPRKPVPRGCPNSLNIKKG